ncbi:hypothetical protein NDU88_001146 [Pleurodeles waltl]|uniref:Uncharacterized protein n=1 Tax=Pleurodeles waltl TaxID=8319 RepID=A0AAV7RAS2_PLEWA|nr:hypothetical protein NDU88_001146 [Pleurodeles waltl]
MNTRVLILHRYTRVLALHVPRRRHARDDEWRARRHEDTLAEREEDGAVSQSRRHLEAPGHRAKGRLKEKEDRRGALADAGRRIPTAHNQRVLDDISVG